MEPKTVRRASGHSPFAGPLTDAPDTVGIPLGISLLTQDGALPIEFLSPGDRIITRGKGFATLLDLVPVAYRGPTMTVLPGAFAIKDITGPVTLPALQKLLVRNRRTVRRFGPRAELEPIAALAHLDGVRDAGVQRLSLLRPVFADDEILYAGGLELGFAASELCLTKAA